MCCHFRGHLVISKIGCQSCALDTFYIVSEGRDLMTYVSDNYTGYNAPSRLRIKIIFEYNDACSSACVSLTHFSLV